MNKNLFIYPILFISIFLGLGWRTHSLSQAKADDIEYRWGASRTNEVIPIPIVQEMLSRINLGRTLADLRKLTGVDQICTSKGCHTLSSRFTGSQDLQWAKDYVYEALVSLRYNVEVINWSESGLSDQNILAHKRGIRFPDQEIYFIAHLDGYPKNGPAADDDGTGAAALLEMARILADMHPSYSVTLFFSTGEEQGSKGSKYFVREYAERLASIKYLISVEMLGYDSNNDFKMELWSADEKTAFQEQLSNIINAYPINLVPEVITGCT